MCVSCQFSRSGPGSAARGRGRRSASDRPSDERPLIVPSPRSARSHTDHCLSPPLSRACAVAAWVGQAEGKSVRIQFTESERTEARKGGSEHIRARPRPPDSRSEDRADSEGQRPERPPRARLVMTRAPGHGQDALRARVGRGRARARPDERRAEIREIENERTTEPGVYPQDACLRE